MNEGQPEGESIRERSTIEAELVLIERDLQTVETYLNSIAPFLKTAPASQSAYNMQQKLAKNHALYAGKRAELRAEKQKLDKELQQAVKRSLGGK